MERLFCLNERFGFPLLSGSHFENAVMNGAAYAEVFGDNSFSYVSSLLLQFPGQVSSYERNPSGNSLNLTSRNVGAAVIAHYSRLFSLVSFSSSSVLTFNRHEARKICVARIYNFFSKALLSFYKQAGD